ncbi:HAD hydrolase family protein [Candidatus Roizmanbacteria bacterium]|nr:HAD hydrolase family protein [Candidatus Roizmanbacteria bacterium]
MSQSIYQYVRSVASNKLAFIDVDGTLTANPGDTNEKDLLDKDLTNQAITELQKNGFTCVLNTSRTVEMCMSEAQYFLSKKNFGFTRPQPHMNIDNKYRHFYVKPEDVVPRKILDLPIIISASGARVDVLQKDGGYVQDQGFYPPDFPDPIIWKKKITSFLSTSNILFSYAPIDSESNYEEGITDIFPADYRIQLSFPTQSELLRLAGEIKKIDGLYLTDDSNPDKNIFLAYLTPKNGKIDAVNHVMSHLQKRLTEILVIGDSFPDLEAGLKIKAPPHAKITCLIVGGSRLHYTPKINLKRKIIMGDVAFHQSIGPKSIVEFIKSNKYNYVIPAKAGIQAKISI